MPDRPIFYVTRFLPGYRVPVMDRLNRALDGRLVVFAGQPPGGQAFEALGNDAAGSFRSVPIENRWLFGDRFVAQSFRKAFSGFPAPRAVLAEEAPRSLTLPLMLRRARRSGAGTILWGHFSSNNRPLHAGHPLDRYRLSLARNANACVCYTEGIADLLRPHLPAESIFVARNTLDMAPLFRKRKELEREGRSEVRKRLGLPNRQAVLCFLGRLIPEKGTTLLLDVVGTLQKDMKVTLLVIGEGPDGSTMRQRVDKLGLVDVRFLGSITGVEELGPYLFAADLMLNPGYLGLSVNHAFGMGLPVVSRRAPAGIRYHSPEGEYVRDGENGLLRSWEDPSDLVRGVHDALAIRERLSQGAVRFAEEELLLERMVAGLVDAIRFVTANRV